MGRIGQLCRCPKRRERRPKMEHVEIHIRPSKEQGLFQQMSLLSNDIF